MHSSQYCAILYCMPNRHLPNRQTANRQMANRQGLKMIIPLCAHKCEARSKCGCIRYGQSGESPNGESPNTVANRQVANRQGLLAFIPLSAHTREARSVGRGIRSLDDQPHRLRNVRVASNEAENADSIFKHSYH